MKITKSLSLLLISAKFLLASTEKGIYIWFFMLRLFVFLFIIIIFIIYILYMIY